MPRLFTGLEIPADLAFELSLKRGGLSGARRIEPSDYHITLRFIGDIDYALARAIDSMLIVIRRAPVEITLDGLLTFGGDKPRILAARVQPTTALSELQADLELLLRGFILYSSRDSVGGGPYIVEANYSLE